MNRTMRKRLNKVLPKLMKKKNSSLNYKKRLRLRELIFAFWGRRTKAYLSLYSAEAKNELNIQERLWSRQFAFLQEGLSQCQNRACISCQEKCCSGFWEQGEHSFEDRTIRQDTIDCDYPSCFFWGEQSDVSYYPNYSYISDIKGVKDNIKSLDYFQAQIRPFKGLELV